MTRQSMTHEQIFETLRDLAEDVSGDYKTKSDNVFYEKCTRLYVKKVAAKIVVLCMVILILMSKLELRRQKIQQFSSEKTHISMELKFHYISSITY